MHRFNDTLSYGRRLLCATTLVIIFLNGFILHSSTAQDHPNNQGLVDLHGVWPFFSITVCWRDNYIQWRDQMHSVQAEVDRVISHSSKYRFVGWNVCNAVGGARIEVTINESWPASEVGRQWVCISGTLSQCAKSQDRPTRMHLNFSMGDTEFKDCRVNPQKSQCIRAIAVHEFLHAIGFLHEQLRADATRFDPACTRPLQEEELSSQPRPASWLPLFAYDEKSIMNYCNGINHTTGQPNPDIYHRPVELPELDNKSLKTLESYTAGFLPRQ